ncbi:uncharacterized protein LOC127881673 isoform X2 [Dreissena polymorpha]|uniref:uncharacterized protein LOC127881673 isoform X2 n=1 Tax=Dreissena polymorpha TaxID=45954 RepID=UPI002264CB6B|nr:uncharacterized protein LOC127881673 isoform X2 [Dreissena polymorpha]
MAAPIILRYVKKLEIHKVCSYLRSVSSCRVLPKPATLCLISVPDPGSLSREYLIKSSSIMASEHAMILLTQTTLALLQAEKEYKEALDALAFLLELKLQVLGDPTEEARIWDIVLEGRDLVQRTRKKRDELQMLQQCTERLVDTAAEVTYMTSAEVVAVSASEKLITVNRYLRETREASVMAEARLTETEVKTIEVEGKYAEEHKEELEEQRQKLIAEGIVVAGATKDTVNSKKGVTKDTSDSKKGYTPYDTNFKNEQSTIKDEEKDDFLEIIDKWGSTGEDKSAQDI